MLVGWGVLAVNQQFTRRIPAEIYPCDGTPEMVASWIPGVRQVREQGSQRRRPRLAFFLFMDLMDEMVGMFPETMNVSRTTGAQGQK